MATLSRHDFYPARLPRYTAMPQVTSIPSHGVVTITNRDGSEDLIRICTLHKWESNPVPREQGLSPDKCYRCVALVESTPGEGRYLHRFGSR